MELKSPPPCPNTAVTTVRRNPPRRARPTPLTNAPPARPTPSANPPPSNKSTPSTNPPPTPKPSSTVRGIPSFPIEDILSIVVPQNPEPNLSTPSSEAEISESLKVFLRIRPLKPVQNQGRCGKNGDQTSRLRAKNVWPQNPAAKNTAIEKKKKSKNKCEMCVTVIDSRSVTLSPPSALQDSKRVKTEVYEGFSHVFSPDSSQDEVYETMVNPLVEEFLNGKSGMLAALGPSGTGKTHTVFGSTREPGMVPLALRRIFKQTEGSELSRSFYISMLEIYSERGKGERLIDLCPENGDSCMPQSTIKGLREVMISDVAQAESLIARGMLKRATAMTNSNNQSSRSQCIIHIRCAPEKFDEEVDVQANNAVLTIVDLAGAEREKRTGNQGARLLESNFINNTSMVFGSCLRSLLEHQKNPKKPLQKHFQNSLLTRYLRAYLEGKKRMSLILTVKPGEEDYLDTSFLLRQASPFMKIKFNNVEEPSTSLSNKRQHHSLHRTEKPKRIKFSGLDASVNEEARNKRIKPQLCEEEVVEKMINEVEPANDMAQSPEGFKLTLGNGNEHQLCEEEVIAKKTKDVELVVKDLDQYPEDFTLIENIGNEHQLYEEEIIAKEAKEVEPAIDLAESPGNFTLIARNENEHELCKELIAQQIEEAGSVKDLPQSPEDCNLISRNGNENQQCEEVFIAKKMEEIEPVNDLGQFPEILKLIESNGDMCQLDEDEDIAKKIEEVEPVKDFAQSSTDSKLIASNGNEEQLQEGNIEKEIKEVEPVKDLAQPLESSKFIIDGGGHSSDCVDLAKRERTHLITQGFAKAIWSVLKEYKHKLKAAENEVHNLKENLMIEETRYSELEKEINELKSSCSCSRSGRISADTDSEPKDTNSGNKNNAEVSNVSVISSCHSLVIPSDASCSSDEKKLDLPLGVKENEALNEGCNIGNAPDVETKPLNAEKPKRRLLPASSVLLRDVSGINFVDENEKPKVNRAEKKFPGEERNRTQGSISLLRMLTSKH